MTTGLAKVPYEIIELIFVHVRTTWISEEWQTEWGGPIGSWYYEMIALPSICRALQHTAEQAIFFRVNIPSSAMLASLQFQLDTRPHLAFSVRQLTLDGFWEDFKASATQRLILSCPVLQDLACPARVLPSIDTLASLENVFITINERDSSIESQIGLDKLLASKSRLRRLRIAFVGDSPQDNSGHAYSFITSPHRLAIEGLELACWWSGWLDRISPAHLICALAEQPSNLSLLYCEFNSTHWSDIIAATDALSTLRINTGLDFRCDASWIGQAYFPGFALLAGWKRLERLEARLMDIEEEMDIHGGLPEHIRQVVIA